MSKKILSFSEHYLKSKPKKQYVAITNLFLVYNFKIHCHWQVKSMPYTVDALWHFSGNECYHHSKGCSLLKRQCHLPLRNQMSSTYHSLKKINDLVISYPKNLKFKDDSNAVHHSCKALIIWLLADVCRCTQGHLVGLEFTQADIHYPKM